MIRRGSCHRLRDVGEIVAIGIEQLKAERDRLKERLREIEAEQRKVEAELKTVRQKELRIKREIEAVGTLIEVAELDQETSS